MNVIKLSAIDSTNDYLKIISRESNLDNFTTVVTQNQTNGRGQMGAIWVSEEGKNLTMSILIKNVLISTNQIYDLNVVISLVIIDVLKSYNIPKLAIKWPNDIMSDHKKIAGILIENRFKADNSIESIVGIGLNVNQVSFSEFTLASSLSIIMNKEYDLNELLDKIIMKIKEKCSSINSNIIENNWKKYHKFLFRKGLITTFEDENKNQFRATINGVSNEGKLEIVIDNSVKKYTIKEIKMVL